MRLMQLFVLGVLGLGTFGDPALAAPPTFTPDPVPDRIVTVGEVVFVTITFDDPDGDFLIFSPTIPPYAGFAAAGNEVTIQLAPLSPLHDSGVPDGITVLADDGTGGQVTASFNVTVNQVPVANAGPDLSAPSGSLVMLDGSGSGDPDADPITWMWTPDAGSPPLLDPTAPEPTLLSGADGETHTYQLVVSDLAASSLPDTVTVTVTAPTAVPLLGTPGRVGLLVALLCAGLAVGRRKQPASTGPTPASTVD